MAVPGKKKVSVSLHDFNFSWKHGKQLVLAFSGTEKIAINGIIARSLSKFLIKGVKSKAVTVLAH